MAAPRLSFGEATAIRRLHSTGHVTPEELADRYGVSTAAIYQVLRNTTHHDPAYQRPLK